MKANTNSAAIKRSPSVAVMALSLFTVLGASATPRLALTSVRGFPGQTVDVPLSLRYGSNDFQNVVALQADLVIDSGNANSAAPAGGSALRDHVLASSEPAANVRRVIAYSLINATITNGVIASIPFTVTAGSFQNVRLSLTNVILSTAEAISLPVTTIAGGIAIQPVYVRPNGDTDGFLTVATNAGSEFCYVVQATSDFSSWGNVFTNTAAGSLLQFCDLTANAFSHRFYRAILCSAVDSARIGTINRLNDGRIEFQVSGASNRRYVVQGSTNLKDWLDIDTLLASGGSSHFLDPASTNLPHRFYRIRTE